MTGQTNQTMLPSLVLVSLQFITLELLILSASYALLAIFLDSLVP